MKCGYNLQSLTSIGSSEFINHLSANVEYTTFDGDVARSGCSSSNRKNH